MAHEDDIAFVMQTLAGEADLDPLTARDVEVSRTMSRYWTTFARTGNPNFAGAPEWRPYSADSGAVLEIGEQFIMREHFNAERLQFHVQRGFTLMQRARGQR